jgi:hypothetical protein
MAVIDRWLAAIDDICASNRHDIPQWSDGGHEFGSLAIGKRQSQMLGKLHPATVMTGPGRWELSCPASRRAASHG